MNSPSIACVFCQFVIAVFLLIGAPFASAQPSNTRKPERCIVLQLFIRSDSKLCLEAQKYVDELSARRGGICVEVYNTLTDRQSLDKFWLLARRFHVEKPRVPLFYVYDQLRVGFVNAEKSGPGIDDLFAIHAYVRSTCQHCRDAKRFLGELMTRWKGIRVVYHDIDRESGALTAANSLARAHGISAPSFPVISVCGRITTGYSTDSITGRQLEELLIKASARGTETKSSAVISDEESTITASQPEWRRFVRPPWYVYLSQLTLAMFAGRDEPSSVEGIASGTANNLPPSDDLPIPPADGEQPSAIPQDNISDDEAVEQTYTAPSEAPEGVELPWFGYVSVRDVGLPVFTFAIGLVDGFNPCAMWVLVFLLSVLVNVKDRRKIAAIAGTFVVVSGLAYFAFMAAWLNVFMLVGIARPLQIVLGVLALAIGAINVKDFFAFKQGVTLSIPESTKPGIYDRVRKIVTTDYLFVAIGLSIVLAVVVNLIELMCTAGLPAIYTQILTIQQLPAWKNYAYLGLYNVAYMFDDSLMVIAFIITLSHRKMRETEGRWLKLISGIVVLALGVAMIFKPEWLQW